MDRLSNGHFAEGNKIGKLGNGISRKQRTYNQLFHEILTEEDFEIILQKVIKSAKGRNQRAQFFLLKMCLPKLIEVTNVEPEPRNLETIRQEFLKVFAYKNPSENSL
jgi:hypothetical protein